MSAEHLAHSDKMAQSPTMLTKREMVSITLYNSKTIFFCRRLEKCRQCGLSVLQQSSV